MTEKENWTQEELDMLIDTSMSVFEMGLRMGRTEASIRSKARRMGIPMTGRFKTKRSRWMDEEKYLVENTEIPEELLSVLFQRNINTVLQKREDLRRDKLNAGKWNAEEVSKLERLVSEHDKDWKRIAKEMDSSVPACRRAYYRFIRVDELKKKNLIVLYKVLESVKDDYFLPNHVVIKILKGFSECFEK